MFTLNVIHSYNKEFCGHFLEITLMILRFTSSVIISYWINNIIHTVKENCRTNKRSRLPQDYRKSNRNAGRSNNVVSLKNFFYYQLLYRNERSMQCKTKEVTESVTSKAYALSYDAMQDALRSYELEYRLKSFKSERASEWIGKQTPGLFTLLRM